jgi:hypothetical protein
MCAGFLQICAVKLRRISACVNLCSEAASNSPGRKLNKVGSGQAFYLREWDPQSPLWLEDLAEFNGEA